MFFFACNELGHLLLSSPADLAHDIVWQQTQNDLLEMLHAISSRLQHIREALARRLDMMERSRLLLLLLPNVAEQQQQQTRRQQQQRRLLFVR